MSATDGDANRRLRTGVYAVLIALAAGNLAGRLLAVNSVNRQELEQYLIGQRVSALQRDLTAQGADAAAIAEAVAAARPNFERELARQRPFLSGNDRSRWLTVRALTEHATFAIDEVLDPNVWNSIDMVKHKGRDGLSHLYSSKPPLFSVLLAGEYWVLSKITGWTLADNPHAMGRLMLMTVNVLPLLLMFALVAGWAERFGATDWGRIFVVAAAAFGTLLSAFAVVINNHLVAAVSTAVAVEAFIRIWFDGERRWRWYALAGLAAAFAAADELPALSLLALMGAVLLVHNWRACLVGFAPAAAVVVAAFFATNYAAHQSLRPPYMHRSATDPADNWYIYEYTLGGKVRDSYWKNPQGIDRGEPTRLAYAFHVLVGHHGVFSLTPVWLLSVAGAGLWLAGADPKRRQLAAGIVLITIVCTFFYIALRPQADRNYGGMTSGFRWLFWLAPLWLILMIPAADRLPTSHLRMAGACVLLVFSVLSASFPTWNPWTQPWIYQWMEASGWQGF